MKLKRAINLLGGWLLSSTYTTGKYLDCSATPRNGLGSSKLATKPLSPCTWSLKIFCSHLRGTQSLACLGQLMDGNLRTLEPDDARAHSLKHAEQRSSSFPQLGSPWEGHSKNKCPGVVHASSCEGPRHFIDRVVKDWNRAWESITQNQQFTSLLPSKAFYSNSTDTEIRKLM